MNVVGIGDLTKNRQGDSQTKISCRQNG